MENKPETLQDYGIDIPNKKIKEYQIPEYLGLILTKLWEQKNSFIPRDDIAAIRRSWSRPGYQLKRSRNISPELSRNIKELNHLFKLNEIPFLIISANKKLMLHIF